jgi:hypothetical protein
MNHEAIAFPLPLYMPGQKEAPLSVPLISNLLSRFLVPGGRSRCSDPNGPSPVHWLNLPPDLRLGD